MVVKVMGEISRVVVTGKAGFIGSWLARSFFMGVIPLLFWIIFVQEGRAYLKECGFYAS
jgi:hypothetical protein